MALLLNERCGGVSANQQTELHQYLRHQWHRWLWKWSKSPVIFRGEGDQQPWKLRCYAIFEQSHIYLYTYTYIHIHIIHTHESRMPTDFATARPRSTDQFCWGPDRLKPPLEGPVSFSKASLSFASNPACADCDFIQAWNSPNTWYTGESVKTDVPVFGWLNVMASCLRMCRKNG